MKILITGASGQLGQELQHLIAGEAEVTSMTREELDLSQPDAIAQTIRTVKADVVVNAAAYTAVDKAESETELAIAINGTAPEILAREVKKQGSFLIHISTDYVFKGTNGYPYLETDPTDPINAYGRSKLAGEQAIQACCDRYVIFRTAWVYGVGGKGNFVKTMLRLGKDREEVRVVADQIGSPTWTGDIAAIISQWIKSHLDLTGIYNYTNSGVASWYDFAVAIFEEAKQLGFPLKLERVVPITTPEYPTPAKRPAYSVLAGGKIAAVMGYPAPHWRQSLRKMLQQLRES